MATNDNSDLEARIAALEEKLKTTDEMTSAEQKESEAAAKEQAAEFEKAVKERSDQIEADRKKEQEALDAEMERIRAEVDKSNEERGANEELVEPEPEPLPEPPPFVNEEENEHNDSNRKKYDSDVEEVTAAVTSNGAPLPLEHIGDEPSPEIERVTDQDVEPAPEMVVE